MHPPARESGSLGRIVGISDKWSGKLPRYHLVGSEAATLLLGWRTMRVQLLEPSAND